MAWLGWAGCLCRRHVAAEGPRGEIPKSGIEKGISAGHVGDTASGGFRYGVDTSARTEPGSAPARATDCEPSTVLGAPSGPGQWRVIEDDYFGAFVGSASWCTACVHGGTVHGPGGSSGGGAAAWGARVRARLSNRTPPAAAAASTAIPAE